MKKVFAQVFFTEKAIYPDWLSKQDVLNEKSTNLSFEYKNSNAIIK